MFRRRFKRTFRRRRYGRRTFRRSNVRRRIMRRALARRPLRPEVKYVTNILASTDVGAAASFSSRITPPTMSQGVGIANRIGNEVMFRKVYIRWRFRDNSGQTGATAPVRQQYQFRLIVWSCRVDVNDCLTYMANNVGTLGIPDFNTVTVYSDKVYNLAPPYIDADNTVTGVLAAGGNANYLKSWGQRILFPRKVRFTPANNDIDGERYGLYFTVISDSGPINMQMQSNTYFVDA